MIQLHLLHCPLSPLTDDLEAELFNRYLDEKEKARYRASNIANSRLQLLISRWLIKQHMHELTGLPVNQFHFHYTDNGKPFLSPELAPDLAPDPETDNGAEVPTQFSLAHCNTSVCVAISNAAVGVDVENRKRNGKPWEIIGDIFNAKVAQRMATLTLEEEHKAFFFTHWTAMESMVKMKGSKVALERKQFALDFVIPHNASYLPTPEHHFYFANVNEHELVAITCAKPASQAQIFTFAITEQGITKQTLATPKPWLSPSFSA